MTRRLVQVVGCCALLAAGRGLLHAGQDLRPQDGARLEQKLATILLRGAQPPARAAAPMRTPLTEQEVNAYFKYQGQPFMPVGVLDPRIAISEGNRLEARAVVDLDAVRKAKARGWTDPLGYVTGSVEVRAIARLFAVNGRGTLQIESTTLGGVPVPKSLLQELVSYYSRTPESPAGFPLDQPFDLPHNIRQVEIQRGTAIIVQ